MRAGKGSNTAHFVAYSRALGTLAPTVRGFADTFAEQFLVNRLRRKVEKTRKSLAKGRRDSPYPSWFKGLGVFNQFRKMILDQVIAQALPFKQLVILGAGLDGRAWSCPGLEDTIVFEVDHPDTQRWKRVQANGLKPIAKEVRFVAMDFTHDALVEKLAIAGYDQSKSSFWLLEGVTMYLTPDDNAKMLADVAQLSSPGSQLAMTYMAKKNGRAPRNWFLSLIGEPLLCAYAVDELRRATDSAGWITESNSGIEDWMAKLAPELTLTEKQVGMQWNERIWVGCKAADFVKQER